jgi:hypothetical protein
VRNEFANKITTTNDFKSSKDSGGDESDSYDNESSDKSTHDHTNTKDNNSGHTEPNSTMRQVLDRSDSESPQMYMQQVEHTPIDEGSQPHPQYLLDPSDLAIHLSRRYLIIFPFSKHTVPLLA